MPQGNITQYTSPLESLDTSKSSEAANIISRSAAVEGELYRRAGQEYKVGIDSLAAPVSKIIDQHETMQDISHGAATLAAMHNNFTTAWNKLATTSDPNDTTIQKDFLDNTVEPQLQKFQDAFTTERGQRWALTQADDMRSHYYEKTAADMSTRAGEATTLNAVSQLNQLSTAAYRDPRSADLSMKQIDAVYNAAIENGSGLISASQAGKLSVLVQDAKNEVVKNAVKGFADSEDPQGPAKAKAVLDSGQYDKFLPKEEADTLYKYIDKQSDARTVEQQQKVQVGQFQQSRANEQEVKNIFSSIASGQGYQATMAFANPKLSTQQRHDLVAQKNGILTLPPEFLTSPAYGDGFGQVASAVYNGQTITAGSLTAGVRRQEITPAGALQLQQITDKMRTPEGLAEVNAQKQVLTQMRSQIIKGGPGAYDPAGQKLYNNMLNSFYPAWDAAIKSGKSPADLANPDSKDYIGNLATSFKRNDAQAIADVTRAQPTMQPGAADISYLKAHPDKVAAFEKTFGTGSAQKILGGK